MIIITRLEGTWEKEFETNGNGFRYECGYCNSIVSPTRILYCERRVPYQIYGKILVCTSCNRPSFFEDDNQVPNKKYGITVKHLPADISLIYEEAKSCYSSNSYTATSLICRKILMNIAVAQGAEEGKSFASYVDYLNTNGFIPPNGKAWVDAIRKHGNDATHQITSISKEDSENIIDFTGLLLTFIYEMPGRLSI